MDEIKLTPAQIRQMESLITERDRAIAGIERFLRYLRDEHNAAEDQWAMNNIHVGFVRMNKEKAGNENVT